MHSSTYSVHVHVSYYQHYFASFTVHQGGYVINVHVSYILPHF